MNIRLLKNKNLSLLVFGQFISLLGSGMQNFAFSLYILRLTGSGSQFASVLAIGMLPRLFLGPICGVFADWFDRKKIIVYLDLISGLLIGGLYFVSIASTISLLHIYITVILLSIISSLFDPAIGTAIPSVVDKDDLMEANSLNSLFMTIGSLIYPMIAGAIFGLYGISVVLLINSISFIFSAISEMFIDLKSQEKKATSFSLNEFKNDFKAGVSFIIDHKLIRKILVLSFIANALLSPSFSVGFIYVANMVIRISDLQLGILQTFMVVGSLLGTIIAGYMSKRMSLAKIIYIALFIIGSLICLIGINSTSYYLKFFNDNLIPYITLTILGLSITTITTVTNVGMSTLQQREVPLEIMGRYRSVKSTISMCAVPMGQMLFGVMIDKVASYIPLITSGIIIIISAWAFNYSVEKDSHKEMVLERKEVLLNIE